MVKLNDSLASETTFSQIKNSGMPYVLFYENINKYWYFYSNNFLIMHILIN